MERRRASSLALIAGATIWVANACTRPSEDELLRGKVCSANTDCVAGYICDTVAGLCARPGFELLGEPADVGDGGTAVGGSSGSASEAGSGGAASGGAGEAGTAGSGGAASNAGGASGSSPTEESDPDAGPVSQHDGGDSETADAASSSDSGSPASDVCAPECSSGYRCVESSCVPAGWQAISPPPPEFVAREKAAYAVAGSKVLIWGGVDASGLNLSTGALYDAAQDTWQLTSVTANTPSGRVLASAAWTGSQFLVWGGSTSSGSAEYKTGAVYDPASQVWTSTAAAATARSGAIPLAYSAQVLMWGGWTRTGTVLSKADRYAVAGDAWTPAANDLLGKREHVGSAGDGTRLYVVAGRSDTGALLGSSAVYDMGTNSWTAQPSLPAARFGVFAAHDGTRLWIWGGRDAQQATGSGLLLGATQWTPTATQGEPGARWAPQHQSGWTCTLQDGRMALVGGHDFADAPQQDGGIYDPLTDSWDPIPNATEAHEWGVGVCVNGEILLWGGATNGTPTTTGERWVP